MHFIYGIVLYVLLLAMILTLTWRMGIQLFSAAVVSFLLAAIFLMIVIPPTDLEKYTNDLIDGHECKKEDNLAVGIVAFIYLFTLFLVVWYILDRAYLDRVPQFSFTQCNN